MGQGSRQLRPQDEQQQQQDDARGEQTHGAADPGLDPGEAAQVSAKRILDQMASNAKVKLTASRDRLDRCLHGIDRRSEQLAADFLSFHDELVSAENMADSIDTSIEDVSRDLGKHLVERPKATVTHITRGAAAG